MEALEGKTHVDSGTLLVPWHIFHFCKTKPTKWQKNDFCFERNDDETERNNKPAFNF